MDPRQIAVIPSEARNLLLMRKYLRAAICRPRSGDV
jgi:hypothetical protein